MLKKKGIKLHVEERSRIESVNCDSAKYKEQLEYPPINKMNAGKIVEFDSLDADTQELIKTSVDARTYSYSPYSNFSVGAALRCEDGTIYRGCNIENAAYSPSICAERAAIGSAVSNGHRKFIGMAVIADLNDTFTSPCGVCRQTIIEFGDIPIFLSRSDLGTVLITSAREILPLAFTGT